MPGETTIPEATAILLFGLLFNHFNRLTWSRYLDMYSVPVETFRNYFELILSDTGAPDQKELLILLRHQYEREQF